MATKVIYKKGTKETYLGLSEHLSNALYFCADTRELYKGDDLYTDGLRLVASYDELPVFLQAAEGKLYVCEDTGNGYVLNRTRSGWKQVTFGVDNDTLEVNSAGQLGVKTIPMEKVENLFAELQRLEDAIGTGGGSVPIATSEQAGIVKPSEEFSVADDGELAIQAVSVDKVTGLDTKLAEVSLVWEDMT